MRKNTTNNNHVVSNEDTDENCVSVNVQHGFKTKIFDNQALHYLFAQAQLRESGTFETVVTKIKTENSSR